MKVMIASKFVKKIKDLFASLWTDNIGNIEVGKNLVVAGTITQNTYELDTDITFDQWNGTTAGITPSLYYGHARISNGKLNIVIGVALTNTTSAVVTMSNYDNFYGSIYLKLPQSVLSKLHPATSASPSIDSRNVTMGLLKPIGGQINPYGTVKSACSITKDVALSQLIFLIDTANGDIEANGGLIARFEFNFILS